MVSRRILLRKSLACVLPITAGCSGSGQLEDATATPESANESLTTAEPVTETAVRTPRYTPSLKITNEADNRLQVTIKSVRKPDDTGQESSIFGDVIFEGTVPTHARDFDLTQYRKSGSVLFIVHIGNDEIYRKTVENYQGLELIVNSKTERDERWVSI